MIQHTFTVTHVHIEKRIYKGNGKKLCCTDMGRAYTFLPHRTSRKRNRNKRHPTHKYTSRTRELKTPGGREKKADQNFLRYRYFSRKEKKRERGGEVIDRRGRRGKKGKATSYFVHGYPIKSE